MPDPIDSPPTVLFKNGDGGYANFRIPALATTTAETLLAFAEARWRTEPVVPRDSGDININWRRSTDAGLTWSPMQVALSQGGDTAGNPVVVVDPMTGDILLLSCRNHGVDSFTAIVTSPDVTRHRRVYVQRSTDDGVTFSAASEITAQVRSAGWRWYSTGPGVGGAITTGPCAGRIVAPCAHTRPPTGTDTGAEAKYAGAHLIYSDDGGRSWQIGASSSNPDGNVNEGENALVLLPDGRTIYASVRCEVDKQPGNRADTYSLDGGQSFVTPYRPQCTLPVPICQGALLTLPDGRLVYSGPSLPTDRAALGLYLSDDDGRTWRLCRHVSGLPAAYSSLTQVDPETIGILYETGDWMPYRRIEFERIPISALGSTSHLS